MSESRLALGAAAVIGLALAPSAHACGGFFCSAAQPVDQAAEEIVFDVNTEANRVTMHVKIEYTGPSEQFAWVVPVAQKPELEVGSNAMFAALSTWRAQWLLTRAFGECDVLTTSSGYSSSSSGGGGGGGGVSVVSSGVVGPYETVVLRATDSGELLDWLVDNGFDLPAGTDEALAPYVADGQYFVALRLAKDRDTGDLQPLVLSWPGTGMSIPIQLTSLAATPDMGLRVYVLGEHRAVPQSYLHLVLNELAVDWWTGGANIDAVIARAADEAGGQGFFTDAAGDPGALAPQVWEQQWATLPEAVAATTDPAAAILTVAGSGLPLDDDTLGVLGDALGLSATSVGELDLVDVLQCLIPGYAYGSTTGGTQACYPDQLASIPFDPVALAADLDTRVLVPRERAAEMFTRAPVMTRMTSSLSPAEMTVDPTFVFNPDMPMVDVLRLAEEAYSCAGDQQNVFDAPRLLTVPDGRKVSLPSINQLGELGLSEIEWLESQGLTTPTNARIERTGPSGPPEVLQDNTALLAQALDTAVEGCGCRTGGGASGAGLLLAAGIVARRRRQPSR
ncbi:MAG: DUF2330 domain-containing protein [Myxococcota bacterium]